MTKFLLTNPAPNSYNLCDHRSGPDHLRHHFLLGLSQEDLRDIKTLIDAELAGRKCECMHCAGRYDAVDPVDCGCTDCCVGYSRPAINEKDYAWHEARGLAR